MGLLNYRDIPTIITYLVDNGGWVRKMLNVPSSGCLVGVLGAVGGNLILGISGGLPRSRGKGGISSTPCRRYLQSTHLCSECMNTVYS